jgi:hypothetical protein
MRDIDDFLPDVLTFAPNCNEPLALKAIRESARRLCQNARLWRQHDEITLVTPECTGICTIADAAIVDIEQAQMLDADGYGPFNLEPKTMAWMNDNRSDWTDDTESGQASYVFQLNPNSVSVYPRQAGLLRLKLVLKPSLEAVTLPDWLYDQHRTAIGRGAAAIVLTTPSDWANPQLGGVMDDRFTSQIATARTEATKGQQGARLRTKGDWF